MHISSDSCIQLLYVTRTGHKLHAVSYRSTPHVDIFYKILAAARVAVVKRCKLSFINQMDICPDSPLLVVHLGKKASGFIIMHFELTCTTALSVRLAGSHAGCGLISCSLCSFSSSYSLVAWSDSCKSLLNVVSPGTKERD